jgi:cytochrome c-type biogenesis protein CcmH/NrfG
MSRKDRGRPRPAEALRLLLAGGDHAGARAEARRLLAGAAAGPDERAAAEAALRSLRPEPGAVALGTASLVLAAAVALWTTVGAR